MRLRWHYIFFSLGILAFVAWGAIAILTNGFSYNNSWELTFTPPIAGTLFLLLGTVSSQIYSMNPYDNFGTKIKKLGRESKLLLAGILLTGIGSLTAGVSGALLINPQIFQYATAAGMIMVIASFFPSKKHELPQSTQIQPPTNTANKTHTALLVAPPSPALKTIRILITVAAAIFVLLFVIIAYKLMTDDWQFYF